MRTTHSTEIAATMYVTICRVMMGNPAEEEASEFGAVIMAKLARWSHLQILWVEFELAREHPELDQADSS